MKTRGFDKLTKRLTAMGPQVMAKAAMIVRNETAGMQQQGQRLAPVRTGHLQRSVDIQIEADRQHAKGTIHGNAYNKGFNYGYAQEEGNSRVKAKHFVGQAYAVHSANFERKMKDVMKP